MSASPSSPPSLPSSSTAGRELLLELKRQQQQQQHHLSHHAATTNTPLPPPYHLKLVRQCLEDLQDSFRQLSDQVAASTSTSTSTSSDDSATNNNNNNNTNKPSMASRPSMLYHHACIQRHKRCLLTYHKHRLAGFQTAVQQQQQQQQQASNSNEGSTQSSSQQWSTNAAELDFVQAYQELRQQYVAAVLPDYFSAPASFRADTPPPASSLANAVQVRCAKSLGQVVLDSGRSVTLTKGSILYLPRADVLEFLQDGTLALLEGEEVDF
jgi:hypothetical protein